MQHNRCARRDLSIPLGRKLTEESLRVDLTTEYTEGAELPSSWPA